MEVAAEAVGLVGVHLILVMAFAATEERFPVRLSKI